MEANGQRLAQVFSDLIRDWQDDIYAHGESGKTVYMLARTLRAWLGSSVSDRDQSDPNKVRLVADHIVGRIADIARLSNASDPHMLLAVGASIGQILQAIQTPEATRAAATWQSLMSNRLPQQLWMGHFDFQGPKRSFDLPERG